VSPDYIRALILTESAGQKYAVSNKGARGLTQIMPETGRLAAQDILAEGFDYEFVDEAKLSSYNPDLLYDPCVNILIACYLGRPVSRRLQRPQRPRCRGVERGPGRRGALRQPRPRVSRNARNGRALGRLSELSFRLPSFFHPARASPNHRECGSELVDLSHSRWDTKGWTNPGWDEKKVNWELPF
jgi:hypothetical protein